TRYWLTLCMQVWVLAAYAYSYQLLYGRAGMLSFGHAVYFGIGAFAAAHALNSKALATAGFPAEAVPLVGMAAGFTAAIVFGYPSTRRAGIPFAMVTLGIGELVAACFLMFPGFFGGEAGISTNRAGLAGWLVQSYGRLPTLYPLLLAWSCLLILAALWVAQTPLGLLARGVRDNAERIGFFGFEAAEVRFKVMLIAGPIAGGAGALAAMLYEIVSVESVSLATSANVLLMTVVGGPASAVGPLVGALALTLMQTALAKITHAWVFYYGLLFILIVLFAPQGITGVVASGVRTFGRLGPVGFTRGYGLAIAASAVAFAGGITVIETLFFRTTGQADEGRLPLLAALAAAGVTVAAGLWLARLVRGRP
ncbi:branched-chain amino acid ABC transporter permease, partial [Ferrovibrio sp.]|uniref:branched-chain amino acid ABC transporter permease n=1 Tax=Ferrovibrio sp. TaxID=1917215 RepID=UPI002606AD4D